MGSCQPRALDILRRFMNNGFNHSEDLKMVERFRLRLRPELR